MKIPFVTKKVQLLSVFTHKFL